MRLLPRDRLKAKPPLGAHSPRAGLPGGRWRQRLWFMVLLGCGGPWVAAFPPAPHFTVFGNVRDEYGVLIPDGAANVILSLGGRELARNPVAMVSDHNYNYQLRMRIDMARLGTSTYSSLAANSGAAFTLAVEIGGVRYYPIEVSTPPTVGSPADRRRLDLTLGEDSDGDGLPDAWEQQQLYYAGLPIDELWRITPDGVASGDGISNVVKYIAITYGSDAAETFFLKILAFTATEAKLEFFCLTNKTYRLEKSTDLVNWAPIDFAVGADPTPVATYVGTAVGVMNCSVVVLPGESKVFYRLVVK